MESTRRESPLILVIEDSARSGKMVEAPHPGRIPRHHVWRTPDRGPGAGRDQCRPTFIS